MVLFPNCKINLGLRVNGKRNDGYHDLETVFYPLPLRDALELVVAPKNIRNEECDPFRLTVTGSEIPGDTATNLCRKAWELVREKHPSIPPVRMFLHKAIPVGAGLGGGSSDAATTLLLLNEVLELGMTPAELAEKALKLGSDCPFFLLNKTSLAHGRGEILETININLQDYSFVLVHPAIHISTAWAFGKLSGSRCGQAPEPSAESIGDIITTPVETWKNRLINDLEKPVFAEYPVLEEIKTELYRRGAAYASMTGTGSCIFGIFRKKSRPDLKGLTARYKVYNLNQSR